MPYHITCA
jgi:hypothetical protein